LRASAPRSKHLAVGPTTRAVRLESSINHFFTRLQDSRRAMSALSNKDRGAAERETAAMPSIAAQIRDLGLRRFYQQWFDKCVDRWLPSYDDVDPSEFADVLGNLLMVDVLRESQRFRVRLHGADMAERMNYDLTGKWLDETPRPEYRAYMLNHCRAIVANCKPKLVVNDLVLGGRISRYEALWLPYSDDGFRVDMLICAIVTAEIEPPQTAAIFFG
jgi:hypothetical protein